MLKIKPKSFKLKNNIDVISFLMPFTETVTVLTLVKIGSRYEEERLQGISHFLEHLFFKGTKKRPTTIEIAHELDNMGAEFNAFTSKEYTGFYITAASKYIDIILDILPEFLSNTELIHQTGDALYEEVVHEAKIVLEGQSGNLLISYHPVNFLVEPEYVAAMQVADLIISRTGAGSIFEIAAVGRASILIPIADSPGGHNRRNAYIFAEDGRAEVIEEANLTPNLLLSVIRSILNNPEKRKTMEEKREYRDRGERGDRDRGDRDSSGPDGSSGTFYASYQ